MWSKQALDGCKLRADCSCQCYCELLCQKPVSEHHKGHYGKHQAAAAQLLLATFAWMSTKALRHTWSKQADVAEVSRLDAS
jgi:hypothetical protein